jgi:hypothetical protein
LETRLEPMLRGLFDHEKRSHWEAGGSALLGPAEPADLPRGWEERIVPSEKCHLDTGVHSLLQPRPWEWDLLIWLPPRRVSIGRRTKRLALRVMRSLSWRSGTSARKS